MPYTPNADDATAPLASVLAGTAAEEFRTLKTKVNNLFLASDYNPDILLQTLKAGTVLNISVPPSTSSAVVYGASANITRNDITPGGAVVVAAQLNGHLGNNLDGFATNVSVFGIACEAWTSEVASHATLVGLEASVISQYNANKMALVGMNSVYKDRPDTLYSGAVSQGLGANKYNANSRAIFISAQPRSTAGENCGWGRGIMFDGGCFDDWFDEASGTYQRARPIDFTPQPGPNTFEPWTAYNTVLKNGPAHGIIFPEYLGISWDRLQYTRTYLDSDNLRFVVYGDGATPTTTPKLCFDYGNNYIDLPVTPVGGAPGAASASAKIKISGTEYYMHLTPV